SGSRGTTASGWRDRSLEASEPLRCPDSFPSTTSDASASLGAELKSCRTGPCDPGLLAEDPGRKGAQPALPSDWLPRHPAPDDRPKDRRPMTLLRDLIHIPKQVHKGDYVLKLTDGVRDPEGTLATCVFTPQLLAAFGDALKLVKSAVEGKQSKAAFLHGSFGS